MKNDPAIAHTDHGSVLQPTDSALIVNADGELHMLMAEYEDEVPEMTLFLGAVLVRLSDPEWVAEMLEIYRGGA